MMNRSGLNTSAGAYGLTSPHTERIVRLSEKINDIHVNIESGKITRVEQIDGKINLLAEQIEDSNSTRGKQLALLKDSIGKLQRAIEEDQHIREHFYDQKDKELKMLEQKIAEKFEQEIHQRKDLERRILVLIEDKSNLLRQDLSKEATLRYEQVEQIKNCLEGDIPKLQEAIKGESMEREEVDTSIMKKVNEEIQKLTSMNSTEMKNREETEEAMLEMLRDMVNRMKGEIENERKDRETTEETLLTLLEDTCTKLTSATHQI